MRVDAVRVSETIVEELTFPITLGSRLVELPYCSNPIAFCLFIYVYKCNLIL